MKNHAVEDASKSGFRKFLSAHLSAFLFHAAHFPPYSIVLYPLIAVFRGVAERSEPIVRAALWAAYFVFIVYFATHSYFFRYEYAMIMNPVFLIATMMTGCWTLWLSARGLTRLAYAPFAVMIIVNMVVPDARPFAWRFLEGDSAGIIMYICAAALSAKFLRGLPRTLVLIVLFTCFFYTGNSLLPAIAMIGALTAPVIAHHTGHFQKMNPVVQAFFAFHMLLTISMAQFYSNSSPLPVETRLPTYAKPMFVYGAKENNIAPLAKTDNRFLSFDASGEALYFGTRMSRPDLFKISFDRTKTPMSYNLKNSSDNMVVHPSGEYIVAGSFGRHSLEKIATEDFRLLKRKKLKFRPIRMRYDSLNNEIYAIGEFSGGSLFVYDAETLVEKRRLIPGSGDRNFRELVVDSEAKALLVSQWKDLVLYDSETLVPKSRFTVNTLGLGRMAIDSKRKIVYLTRTHAGLVTAYSYDGGRLKEIDSMYVGKGARDIDCDSERNILAVANYFSGELSLVSTQDKKVLFRLKLGNRMRHVEFSDAGKSLAVTTMKDAYVLDINAALTDSKATKRRLFGKHSILDIVCRGPGRW